MAMKLKWQAKNPGSTWASQHYADPGYVIFRLPKPFLNAKWQVMVPDSLRAFYPDNGFTFREAKAYCNDHFNRKSLSLATIDAEMVIKCLRFYRDKEYVIDSLDAQFPKIEESETIIELLNDLGYKQAHGNIQLDRNGEIVIKGSIV